MPDIRFNCPMCNQQLEAPDEYAGQVIECPACQKEITVPGVEPVEQKVSGTKCPECGGALEEGVVLCIKCGFHLKLGKKIATDFK
jgi:hypothetical protein